MSKEKKDRLQHLYFLPLILITGYIPLLVLMVNYDTGLEKVVWGFDAEGIDFFCAVKMYAGLAVSAVMLGMLIYAVKKDGFVFNLLPRSFLMLAAYGVFVLLSSIVTPWRSYAFTGTVDMFQTAPVVLSYILMCVYAFYFLKTEEQLLFLAKSASAGVLLMGIIGASQAIDHNILHTDFALKLILLGKYEELKEQISVGEAVYGTLSNPDYYGMYIGLIFPVTVAFLLITKNKRWRAFIIVIQLLLIISFIKAGISSAYIAFIISFMIGFLVLASRSRKFFLITIAVLVTACILLIFSFTSVPALREKASTVLLEKSFVQDPQIETLDDEIHFVYPDGHELHILFSVKSSGEVELSVADAEGIYLPLVPYDHSRDDIETGPEINTDNIGDWVIDDDSYDLTSFSVITDEDAGSSFLRLFWQNRYYDFANADNTYYYVTDGLRNYVKIEPPEKYNLFPDAFMTGRGWIWNYALTMLKHNMLLGIGSNIFIFEFPHNYAHYANGTELDAKPHSIYLQQWIENGFPAFCLFCLFFILYFIDSVKLLRHTDRHNFYDVIGFGLFLGIINYMISGFVNDGMLFISPFYWIFIGFGIKINRIISLQRNGS